MAKSVFSKEDYFRFLDNQLQLEAPAQGSVLRQGEDLLGQLRASIGKRRRVLRFPGSPDLSGRNL